MTELRAAHELTNDTDRPIYWIAQGPGLVFDQLSPGSTMSTGEQSVETFTSLRLWRARVLELGGSFT
jgi:hypothetical protein